MRDSKQRVQHAQKDAHRGIEATTVSSMEFASIDELDSALAGASYLADRGLATALYLALTLEKPLLLEGEAGVGKTEAAKAIASALGAPLIRLQCYEGLDIAHAVYEWNYARQLLHIRAAQARHRRRGRAVRPRVPDPAAGARGDRVRAAGAAPDRRDRPRRRGVRGVPARGALRLPGHGAGARDDRREAAAVRDPHVEPHARAARRAQAALPLPLDRPSDGRARDPDRRAARARRARAARRGGGSLRRRAARRSTCRSRRASRRRSTGCAR